MIGRTVGNYRVEKQLGAGGMGTVYLVRHRQLPNTVAALKVLRGGLADTPMVTQRFVQEALVAAAIGGHRVARPLDVGRFDDGAPYILMELVEGRTLSDKLAADGPLPASQLFAIAYRVADTMSLAHARGIVHRDLKPSNIMLTGAGEANVKLLDFGVARAAGELKLAETREATIIGSPGYLSPEAASGLTVNGKTDVFSLGVVLFKMATGELPFAATLDREAMTALLTQPAPLPSSRRPTSLDPLPASLDELVARTLEKDPAQRPSMEELRDELRALLGSAAPDEALSAITPTPLPSVEADPLAVTVTHIGGESDLVRLRERVEKFAESRLQPVPRSRRRWWAAMAVALLLLGAGAWLTRKRAPPPVRAASLEQHQITFVGDAKSLGLSPDGRTLAYVSGGRLLFRDLERKEDEEVGSPSVSSAFFRADSYDMPRWREDSSALELDAQDSSDVAMHVVVSRVDASIDRGPASEDILLPSPDGHETLRARLGWKRIEIIDSKGTVWALPVSGTYSFLKPSGWSSDGGTILFYTTYQGSHRLWTIRRDGSAQTLLWQENRVIQSPGFTADGHGVVYLREETSEEHNLVYLPLAGGGPRVVIEGLRASALSLSPFSLSRDGRRLAYTRAKISPELWVVTVSATKSGQPTLHARRLLADSTSKLLPRISPAGDQISYSGADGQFFNVFVMPVDGGVPRSLSAEKGDKLAAAWSPDGRELAFEVFNGDKRSIHVASVSGGTSRRLPAVSISTDATQLFWAPLGFIGYSSEGNRNFTLIDAVSGQMHPLLDDDSVGWLLVPITSPDGRKIAAVWNRQGQRGVWLISADGKPARPLTKGLDLIPVGWSSDSNEVYLMRSGGEGIASPKVFRVPIAGGDPRLWITLPIDRPLGECAMSADGARIVCTAGREADVWMIERFDEVLAGKQTER